MKVLLPFLRSAYAFRSMQLAAEPADFGKPTVVTSRGTSASTPTGLARHLPELAPDSRRVVLVRHASTDWNARGLLQGGGFDVQLNEEGQAQAKALANELRRALPQLDVVVSSHLARSSETADIVSQTFRDHPATAAHHHIRIINHKFAEMRFGEMEGLAIKGPNCKDETRRKFRDWNSIMHENHSIPWPGGGESIRDVQKRAHAGLAQILLGFPDCQHICIVGHGRFNKILLMSLLGLTSKDCIQQGNTGINVIDVDRHGSWKAHAIDYLEHTERSTQSTDE